MQYDTPSTQFLPRRRRRSFYGSESESRVPRWVVALAKLLLILVILYIAGGWVLRLFGVGNPLESKSATVSAEEGTLVNVSIEDGDWQRAENGMKLHPGDGLSTSGGAPAALSFFEGSWVRLAPATDLHIDTSAEGPRTSTVTLDLKEGQLWFSVPKTVALSGSIVRTVRTPHMSLTIPPDTDALIGLSSLAVFSASGPGITIEINNRESIIVGEGQRFSFPADKPLQDDLYAHRSPLDLLSQRMPFVKESRALRMNQVSKTADAEDAPLPSDADFLTVREPAPDTPLTGGSVTVSGTAGPEVQSVQVNGYPAVLDRERGTFHQDIAAEERDSELDIVVEALDEKGEVIAEVRRRLKRVAEAPLALPTIDTPAKTGDTYRTNQEEIIVRGTSPGGAVGMIVNDYRLQLFNPQKGEWSYLASKALGNMVPGTNTYDVSAVFEGDRTSAPVRLTIIWGSDDASGPSSSSSHTSSLANNPPLLPGSLALTGDAAGSDFTATGTGFLLEGRTSAHTASLWINGYQLKLYKPGKETWNYIASPAMQNLSRGKNTYTIVARNDEGKILDRLTAEVMYRP